jgi:AcrR family transcriptional regulator
MIARERRQEERRARWQQIVDAASKVFFKKGYYRTTIDDIENASELTRGAIYYHFKGKEEIYISVLSCGLRMLRDKLRRVSHNSTLTPDELVIQLFEAYCDFSKNHKEYIKILMHYYSGWEKEQDLRQEVVDEINRLISEGLQVIVEVFERGKEDGLFSIEDPFLEAILMWSMIDGALRKTTLNPRTAFFGIEYEKMKAGLMSSILNSLYRGIPSK